MEKCEWKAQEGYKLSSDAEKDEIISDLDVIKVIDPIEAMADDLFELYCPDRIDDVDARDDFKGSLLEDDCGLSYGEWFHFPWQNAIVHFPEENDYYDLRTFRNRNLITKEEQLKLRNSKIAVFGLSVGSNALDSIVQSGIGNEYMLFDPDRLSVANLNRIRSTMGCVGLKKTEIAGRKIAELDPFSLQAHFEEGYNSAIDDVLRKELPNLIIEDVDDVNVKVQIRAIAKELMIPLITVGDVDDRIVLDIERYDQGVKIFNGKISDKLIEKLLKGEDVSKKQQEDMLIKMLGMKNMSPRLVDSGVDRYVTLSGFPQLGTTSTVGGAMAGVAARDILLGRKIDSDTRVEDMRKAVGSKKYTTLLETARILHRFIKYKRDQK